MANLTLKLGNCVEVLRTFADNSIPNMVSDPPYHIGFMSKTWDQEGEGVAFSQEFWREVYRVIEPGGVVKAFSATRTYHRMIRAMVTAGFTDVGLNAWCYSSGFPKSKNIGLFLDKHLGASGDRGRAIPMASLHLPGQGKYSIEGGGETLTSNRVEEYDPKSQEGSLWRGWGTALKPAWEPIVIGRKPQ